MLLIIEFINFIHYKNLKTFLTLINYKNKIDYKYVPLESVAIYVPGSTVSYPSSVLDECYSSN